MNDSRSFETTRPVDVLAVGDCNPDLVLTGDVRPRFGQEEQLLDAVITTIGGSASIVACGLARLGLRTRLVAAVGDDQRGVDMVDALRARDVDVSAIIVRQETPTGLSVILSAPGDRSILTLPGALPTLRADEVGAESFAGVRHVHFASYFLLPELARGLPDLLRRARDAGCTTSLDTNWDPAGDWADVREVLPLVDVFMPNDAELLSLSGLADHCPDAELIAEAARSISALGPLVAVKAGKSGAIGWGPEGRVAVESLPVDVADTTGSGDSFDAAFLAAYLAGAPFEVCLQAGAIGGSLAARGVGGTSRQATSAELAAHLARFGWSIDGWGALTSST